MSNKKTESAKALGFISLLSIVISSQIGAGALSMPTVFAGLGISGLISWLTVGFMVMILAYIFAQLSIALPYTGGPHVYIKHVFGRKVAFFAGWLYWLISWISTTILLIECVGYLNQVLQVNQFSIIMIGLLIWSYFNYLNYTGVNQAANMEIGLTTVKIAFFCFFIVLSGLFFDKINLIQTPFDILAYKTGLSSAMWCFIGLEVATVPVDLVENPTRTIPRAIIIGTIIVIFIYIFSIIGVMGLLPYQELMNNNAPYALIANQLFGGKAQTFFALLVFLICASSLNAWILISSQIASGLAQDKLLPAKFAQLHNGVPYFGIYISFAGVSLIWIYGSSFSLLTQMIFLIESTVPAFILIYLLCCLSFMNIYKQVYNRIIGILGVCSCLFILSATTMPAWLIIIALICSGLPIFKAMKLT